METFGLRSLPFLPVSVAGLTLAGFCSMALGVPPRDVWPEPLQLSAVIDRADGVEPVSRRVTTSEVIQISSLGGDDCGSATPTVVSVPGSVSIFGDSTGATGPDTCLGSFILWWDAFEITDCANVTLDLCGSSPVITPAFAALADQCAPDGVTCGGFIGADASDRGTCVDENLTMVFSDLNPGIYYYPIIVSAEGPYQMNVTTTSSTACPLPLGSCCTASAGTCTDDVAAEDCSAAGQSFTLFGKCCELECRDPAGPEFDSSGVTLLSRVTFDDFATFLGTPGNPHTGNEMWGYTSPSGREYAIIGTTTGTGYVEVTDPANPVIVEFIDDGVVSTWRDMDTFGELAYVVAESSNLKLQIIDLSDIDNGNVTAIKTTDLGAGLASAHNVFINADSATLYLPSSNLSPGGELTAVSLADPVNPVIVGQWTNPGGRCHDVQVITYTSGPNAGKEIAFCFVADAGLHIIDVTDKASMVTLSTLTYPALSICHQGWVSDNGRFVFFGDEGDELDGFVARTTTYVADVSDLTAPTLAGTFEHDACSIDHNMMVRGDYLYLANYATGLRVLDVSSPTNPVPFAHFDTRPEDNATDFVGAWGVYTNFASGIVVVSDRQRGLFVFANPEPPPLPPPPIPAVTTWGLTAMMLLMLAAGSIVVRRATSLRPGG